MTCSRRWLPAEARDAEIYIAPMSPSPGVPGSGKAVHCAQQHAKESVFDVLYFCAEGSAGTLAA